MTKENDDGVALAPISRPSQGSTSIRDTIPSVNNDTTDAGNKSLIQDNENYLCALYHEYNHRICGGSEWSAGIVLFAAIFIGAIVGLLVAAIQQVILNLLEVVWVMIPEAICHGDSPCPGLWSYNIVAIVILWVLAGILIYTLAVPGPEAPGMPVLIAAVHDKGFLIPKSGPKACNVALAMLKIWIVNFVFITGATSIGPEIQCMLTGALFASWVSHFFGQNEYLHTSRVLCLCGMASGLACFFSLPTSSVLFAIEIPTRGIAFIEGLPAILAAAITGCLVNAAAQGLQWGAQLNIPDVTIPATNVNILLGVVCGVLGFLVARTFLFLVSTGKKLLSDFEISTATPLKWLFSILIFAVITGILSMIDPYSMFYSETELATIVTLGASPLPHYSSTLYGLTQVGSASPTTLTSWELLVTGLIKIFNVSVCACYFPGGVIWPLFYGGMCVGGAWATWIKSSPDTVLLYMLATGAATESPALKNPLGAALVVVMSVASGFKAIAISSAIETCVVASFISWFLSYNVPYFPPQIQKPRDTTGMFMPFMERRSADKLEV